MRAPFPPITCTHLLVFSAGYGGGKSAPNAGVKQQATMAVNLKCKRKGGGVDGCSVGVGVGLGLGLWLGV